MNKGTCRAKYSYTVPAFPGPPKRFGTITSPEPVNLAKTRTVDFCGLSFRAQLNWRGKILLYAWLPSLIRQPHYKYKDRLFVGRGATGVSDRSPTGELGSSLLPTHYIPISASYSYNLVEKQGYLAVFASLNNTAGNTATASCYPIPPLHLNHPFIRFLLICIAYLIMDWTYSAILYWSHNLDPDSSRADIDTRTTYRQITLTDSNGQTLVFRCELE